jgi:SAM-dependent methyltransferase
MIYDYPQYYEAAFSFRDIPREAAFLRECIEKYSDIEARWLFEVACGPAPHAGELGRLGYRYIGLDNNRNMLDFAIDKWKNFSPRPEFLEGDMVSFEIPRPIDFAYVMLGSLYLNTLDDMTSHFDSVARALRRGGLYLLDWCVQFEDPLKYSGGNTVTYEHDGITVESRFDIRLVDASRQMYEEVWTLEVNDRSRRRKLQMFERNRAIFPKDFLTFLKARSDFEFVGWWKDWDLNHPITEATDITRPVALLRRR